ncbi:hypothetical protein ACIBCA_15345 [Kitasatospora sp. NPDC051170]|uniref:hypothetical protein n=1 Tax=Kitasatospora sp. NPDC051170 TaxID=3364056 RepID=UPI0037BA6CD8
MADGLSPEERAVRALMHHAVDGIHPDPTALTHLRRAVPRRRAARRGAWTGAAALALAVAVALPALHDGEHLGLSGGPGSPGARGPSVTGPGSATGTAGGDTGSTRPGRDGGGGTVVPSGVSTASPSPGSGSPAATASPGATPVLVPLCTRSDLGQGAAQVGAADAAGRVYGSFTVYNVSGRSCRLGGPGAVAVTAVTGADRARVRTADHAPGDPADGLPAMDTEPPVLAPQAGYRVPFAWVPDQTCGAGTGPSTGTGPNQPAAAASRAPAATEAPSVGGSAAPSANPEPTTTPTANPTGAPSPTSTAPTGNPSATPATATIAHTPAPGSPTAATATVPVPCSGTLYRGGVQPAGASAGSPTAR